MPRAAEEETPDGRGLNAGASVWSPPVEKPVLRAAAVTLAGHLGACRSHQPACCTIAADLIRQQPIGRRKTRRALPLIDDAIGLRQPMANISTMRARTAGQVLNRSDAIHSTRSASSPASP
jgi:hypothetical protein